MLELPTPSIGKGFSIYEIIFVISVFTKAPLPIDVTLLGIVTELSPVQPEKAQEPIDSTPFGIIMEESSLHPSKALLPIDVTLLEMEIEASS